MILVELCLILIRFPSGKSEMRKIRHSREGGNPVLRAITLLDSRLRGNDGENGRHGWPSKFCISDGQKDIIFGNGYKAFFALRPDCGSRTFGGSISID